VRVTVVLTVRNHVRAKGHNKNRATGSRALGLAPKRVDTRR
jgi:hypothetical protein